MKDFYIELYGIGNPGRAFVVIKADGFEFALVLASFIMPNNQFSLWDKEDLGGLLKEDGHWKSDTARMLAGVETMPSFSKCPHSRAGPVSRLTFGAQA